MKWENPYKPRRITRGVWHAVNVGHIIIIVINIIIGAPEERFLKEQGHVR